MKTIYHPRTTEISATIEKLQAPTKFGDHYEIKVFAYRAPRGRHNPIRNTIPNYTEWAETYKDAIREANSLMEYIYSGKESYDRAVDREYRRAERFACGGY